MSEVLSAATVRRRSPAPMRSPTMAASRRARSVPPRAISNRVRTSEVRDELTALVGRETTRAKTGLPAASWTGWTSTKRSPRVLVVARSSLMAEPTRGLMAAVDG